LVDAQGTAIGPIAVLSLGAQSSGQLPWEVAGIAPPTPPSPAPPTVGGPALPGGSGCVCGTSCGYGNDGMCDDGGNGAEYSLCTYGSDCFDCGQRPPSSLTSVGRALGEAEGPGRALNHLTDIPPSPPPLDGGCSGRRMQDAAVLDDLEVAHAGRQPLFAGLHPPVAEEAEAEEAVSVAPGQRRLLKGGSSGSSGGSYSGGRGYSGSSRFGSSGTSTSYTRTSSSPRYYTSGGRTYYSGTGSYRYGYSRSAIPSGTNVYVVRRGYYGCYGCYYRTCYSCNGCRSRRSCGHQPEVPLTSSLDRYELELPFQTPDGGSAQWPLYLRVYNFTVFTKSAKTTTSAYVTFYTSDGDNADSTSKMLQPIAWLGLIGCSVLCFIYSKKLFVANAVVKTDYNSRPAATPAAQSYQTGSVMTPSHATNPMPTAIPAMMPTAMPTAMPAAMPVATASAVPSYPTAYPTAYPSNAMPTAYPTTGYPQAAQAYPSAPPSPPQQAWPEKKAE